MHPYPMTCCDTKVQGKHANSLPEEPRCVMNERSVVATSLRLLGVEEEPAGRHARAHAEYRRRVGAVPVTQLLRRPTSEALCAAVHFCLWRLDARRAQTAFRPCFPPASPAHSRELKQRLSAWLQELERGARLPRSATTGSASAVLASPTPARALALLGALSRHTLTVVAAREGGVVEVPAPNLLPPAVQQQRLVALAQLFVAERRRFARVSARASRSLAALADEHAALTQERAQLLQELGGDSGAGEGAGDADLSAVGVVGLMEPLWARLEELKETTDKLAEVEASQVETTAQGQQEPEHSAGETQKDKKETEGIDGESLARVCARRGLPQPGGAQFDASALVGAAERVAGALPTATTALAERVAACAAAWRALAEAREAALQEARAAAAQDARAVGALAQHTAALERTLLPPHAAPAARAELAQHGYPGVALVPVDPTPLRQCTAHCLAVLEKVCGGATEPSTKRRRTLQGD